MSMFIYSGFGEKMEGRMMSQCLNRAFHQIIFPIREKVSLSGKHFVRPIASIGRIKISS